MRILIIGANGTIGKKLTPHLSKKHEIITAGRNSGDIRVDITSEESITEMYKQIQNIDACICIAASGPLDNFSELTESQLLQDFKGKLFGQVNLVLLGQKYLNDNGTFTLTSGVFADIPYKGVTAGGMISGALHSFVLSASIELPRRQRINVVSPSMIEDSVKEFGHLFPGLKAVSMNELIEAYEKTIEQNISGQILKVY
ncbi:short chain dehydrogenase [Olivibacter ginsenosidimutans]|uniref:Short chain dehydrogenase n=1 Tax=Olivibacter ginsenosidimutans TaxID=1176537 RepID=A0ABP9AWB7_9SPHI